MGLIKSEKNLIAQSTELGWVVSGAFGSVPGARVVTMITNHGNHDNNHCNNFLELMNSIMIKMKWN